MPATSPGDAVRELVVDDAGGDLLWASPTAGPPISLAYVPAGTQCLIYVRPRALLAHQEGEKVLAALGPWGQSLADRLHALTGAEFAEFDSILVSLVVRKDGELDACLRGELASPLDETQFDRRSPGGNVVERRGLRYRQQGDRASFVTSRIVDKHHDLNRTLVVCPAEFADELFDSAGQPPPVVRDLEAVVETSDDERIASLLLLPNFIKATGAQWLAGRATPLRSAVEQLAGNDATALSISAHWDVNLFLEVRATPALDVTPRRLAAKLRERIGSLPDFFGQQVTAGNWHPYGRKVLAQFPGMLRELVDYIRSGEEDRQALVRCYLPANAGHNLLMASELFLTLPHEVATTDSIAGRPTAEPKTIAERLAAHTSLSFAKESLERAIELLSDDVGVPIDLAGADLRAEGITKNQSLTLDLRDQSAGDILVEILRRANPDRAAASPADPRQKLVYVVHGAAAGRPGRIIVTTRAAAEKRNDPLPDVFVGRKP